MKDAVAQPTVCFEHDRPSPVFEIEAWPGFTPYNYKPELYIFEPDGTHVVTIPMMFVGMKLVISDEAAGDPSIREALSGLDHRIRYKSQVSLLNGDYGEGLGLLDVISPYWLDYIPPEDHVLYWGSGVPKVRQTLLTNFPWEIRESYRLRKRKTDG